jgi:hypothetical protein
VRALAVAISTVLTPLRSGARDKAVPVLVDDGDRRLALDLGALALQPATTFETSSVVRHGLLRINSFRRIGP